MPKRMKRDLLRCKYQLSPQLGALLILLVEHDFVTHDMCSEIIGNKGNVRLYALRLRRALEKYNIHINTTRSVGYWLPQETRHRLAKEATPCRLLA